MSDELPEAADAYARLGLHVFPCLPDQKEPATSNGFKAATCDRDRIDHWWGWDDDDYNIGAVPGYSGYIVLDVDKKPDQGVDGDASLLMLECEHGELPHTWTVRTPSGGRHLWFRLPDGMVPPANAKPGDGLDVRSGNGYVLLPPSVIDGVGSYAIEDDGVDIAELPGAWARALDRPATDRSGRENVAEDELDRDEDIARAQAYLAQTARPAIQGRDGDATTYKVACNVRDLAISEAMCLELMAEHYNPRCEPPWPVRDGCDDPEGKCLASKVAHAYEYAKTALGERRQPSAREAFSGMEVDQPSPRAGTEPSAGPSGGIERKTRPMRFMSPSDVEDLEPPGWLIDNCLPQSSLIALYGAPGSLKSFLALDWAYHLAHGMDWAGLECDEPKRVLYVAGEGTAGVKKRLAAWRMHHGHVLGGEADGNLVVSDNMPQIGDDEAWPEHRADIEASGPWDLVVFDTLAYLTFGLEENSNTDMMRAVKRLTDFAKATGAAVMVVHHTGADGDKLRGATSILAACDTVFRLDKDTQVNGQGRLHMTKQKDAEAWHGHLGLQSKEYEVGQDHKGRRKTSLALIKGYHNTTPSSGEVAEAVANTEAREAFSGPPEEDPAKLGAAIGEILEHNRQTMATKDLAKQLALHFGRTESEAGYIESLLKSEAVFRHPMVNQYVPPKQIRGGKAPGWWRLPDA